MADKFRVIEGGGEKRDVAQSMLELGREARRAARQLALAPRQRKNAALMVAAGLLRTSMKDVLEANARDMEAATAANASKANLDRLLLTEARVEAMAKGLEDIAALPDPVGRVLATYERPNGLKIERVATPLGVIGVIYESRPNVTADAGALCLKAGNAAILRGGSEAIHSNRALAAVVRAALAEAGLPEDAVQLVPTTDREAVGHLIAMPEFVDVVIPRGGKGLIERISREAQVPVIKHLDGNCHTYVDDPCDLDMAVTVTDNAKTQKYSPCNASEGLLVARGVAAQFLPRMGALFAAKGVEMRCDPQAKARLAGVPGAKLVDAIEQDWFEEYLAPIISVKVVAGLDEAIAHINRYGSHHTDAILTRDHMHAQRFLREVDSASVMVNASTRFADGFEYGLGAEIGISTDKLHARGPMALEELTSYKYQIRGSGQTRA